MARFYRRRRIYSRGYKNITPGFSYHSINAENREPDPTKYATYGTAFYVATSPVYVGRIKFRFGVSQYNHDNQVDVPLNPGIPWAIYYLASGRNGGDYNFNNANGDPWSPTKDILATGVMTDKEIHNVYLKYGRKLNVGDQLVFAFGLPGANPAPIPGLTQVFPNTWEVTSVNIPLNIAYKEYV